MLLNITMKAFNTPPLKQYKHQFFLRLVQQVGHVKLHLPIVLLIRNKQPLNSDTSNANQFRMYEVKASVFFHRSKILTRKGSGVIIDANPFTTVHADFEVRMNA